LGNPVDKDGLVGEKRRHARRKGSILRPLDANAPNESAAAFNDENVHE
jgi:hypothetical protein